MEHSAIFAFQKNEMENKAEKIKPYDHDADKKGQIETMFDNIASKYDFLNHVLTLGIDKGWRKNLIKILASQKPNLVLDVATGTGDLAILAAETVPGLHVKGLDLSKGMLEVGKDKVFKKNLQDRVTMIHGDSENLPFKDNTFDAITVAFGVRNFENLDMGLKEMNRVLKAGGNLFILEFSRPKNILFRKGFNLYFKYILPFIGKVTSKDPKAYKYLFESVQAFPAYEDFLSILDNAGFKSNNYKIQSLGICSIYSGKK